MKEFLGIWRRYYRLLRLVASPEQRRRSGISGLASPTSTWESVKAVAGYGRGFKPRNASLSQNRGLEFISTVESLAQRWGLNAPWAAPRLAIAIAEPLLYEGIERFSRPTPQGHSRWYSTRVSSEAIKVTVEPSEDETWEQVADRILHIAKPQWERIYERMLANPAWERFDTRPKEGKHLEWLYQRILPTPNGRPAPWKTIAEEADLTPSGVSKSVTSLALELGLLLPVVKPGKPRGG
jgi:hypothetical protein